MRREPHNGTNKDKIPQRNLVLMVALLAIVGVVSYYMLVAPDRRTSQEKISDAMHEMSSGVDESMRQLEDRTPGEKLGDAVRDAGEDIKRATNQQ